MPDRDYLVVVVDDDRHVRELICVALENAGLNVRAVEDGKSALREIRESKPDLVITNLTLRNLTGDQLITAIRTDSTIAGIPILVVSGHLDSTPVAHSADGEMSKPFDPHDLVRIAVGLIRRSRQP